MRVCLCDERMASGSGRLTVLLCGCTDGLRAVCSLTRPSAQLAAKRTGVGVQVKRVRRRGVRRMKPEETRGGETGKECANVDGRENSRVEENAEEKGGQ